MFLGLNWKTGLLAVAVGIALSICISMSFAPPVKVTVDPQVTTITAVPTPQPVYVATTAVPSSVSVSGSLDDDMTMILTTMQSMIFWMVALPLLAFPLGVILKFLFASEPPMY